MGIELSLASVKKDPGEGGIVDNLIHLLSGGQGKIPLHLRVHNLQKLQFSLFHCAKHLYKEKKEQKHDYNKEKLTNRIWWCCGISTSS